MKHGTLETTGNLGLHQENFLEIRGIQLATAQEIERQINNAYIVAANASEQAYGRGRGADQLLVPGKDYAELPGFLGKSPREIIYALFPDSKVLDVGCGYGQLGAEILGTVRVGSLDDEFSAYSKKVTPPINASVKVYGFDAQAQRGQERLSGVVIGNVDDLSPATFGKNFGGFDLVVSSSVLYHLPDYWGAILRMAKVLNPNGVVLASTLSRVIRFGIKKGVENRQGGLDQPDNGQVFYYRNRNVFDTQGKLIPPGQVVAILNKQNNDFQLEYGVASTDMVGATTNGGQISGQRLSADGNLDLSSMFYCLSKGDLCYIITQTPEEKIKLQKEGYINLHDRLSAR